VGESAPSCPRCWREESGQGGVDSSLAVIEPFTGRAHSFDGKQGLFLQASMPHFRHRCRASCAFMSRQADWGNTSNIASRSWSLR
jgi:hypothetical protein